MARPVQRGGSSLTKDGKIVAQTIHDTVEQRAGQEEAAERILQVQR